MEASKRKKLLGCAAILVAFVVFRVGLGVWGTGKLKAYDTDVWQKELAKETARRAALRMPVLRGEPLDEDASPKWWELMEGLGKSEPAFLSTAVTAGWAGPRDPAVAEVLEKNREVLRAFHENARRTRSTWAPIDLSKGPEVKIPNLTGARALVRLVVVEGHELARAGDAAGAAACYLEAVRFSSDLGAAGTLITSMISVGVSNIALDALGAFVASDVKGVPLDAIARDLAKLEPVLPVTSVGLQGELLFAGSVGHLELSSLRPLSAAQGRGDDALLVLSAIVFPTSALFAHAQGELDAIMREMIRASELVPSAREVAFAAVEKRALGSWNPIVQIAVPNVLACCKRVDGARAKARLVVAALSVESKRGADGSAPKLEGLELPVDPYALDGARLRYAPAADGRGWTLWSVGMNGKDESGSSASGADDLALTKKAP